MTASQLENELTFRQILLQGLRTMAMYRWIQLKAYAMCLDCRVDDILDFTKKEK